MSEKQKPVNQPSETKTPKESLSQQYGGIHAGSWVDLLPRSWVPYVQLARLSPPAALFLIYLPHLYGAMHAAKIAAKSPNAPGGTNGGGTNGSGTVGNTHDTLRACALLLGGSFFYSNAAHAWNDLIDAPVDRKVARTKNRPIARGDITPRAAFLFTASQALSAASFLLFLPKTTALATIPSIVGATYYPWAKLHTYFPQLVLGACLAWGTVVGASTLGMEEPWADGAVLCLVTALVLWTSIYDTIYAYQDIVDDEKVGVKSTAVLFKEHTKTLLWFLLALKGVFLIWYGSLTGVGIGYYIITFGGCMSSLGTMIAYVKLKDQASCWWWFSIGFWFTGAAIALGLLFEYILTCFDLQIAV